MLRSTLTRGVHSIRDFISGECSHAKRLQTLLNSECSAKNSRNWKKLRESGLNPFSLSVFYFLICHKHLSNMLAGIVNNDCFKALQRLRDPVVVAFFSLRTQPIFMICISNEILFWLIPKNCSIEHFWVKMQFFEILTEFAITGKFWAL